MRNEFIVHHSAFPPRPLRPVFAPPPKEVEIIDRILINQLANWENQHIKRTGDRSRRWDGEKMLLRHFFSHIPRALWEHNSFSEGEMTMRRFNLALFAVAAVALVASERTRAANVGLS